MTQSIDAKTYNIVLHEVTAALRSLASNRSVIQNDGQHALDRARKQVEGMMRPVETEAPEPVEQMRPSPTLEGLSGLQIKEG